MHVSHSDQPLDIITLKASKSVRKRYIEGLIFEALTNMAFKFTDLFPVAGLGWFIDFVLRQHKRLRNVFNEVDIFVKKVVDDHLKNKHGLLTSQDLPDMVDAMLNIIDKQEENEAFKLTIDHLYGVISVSKQSLVYDYWINI